MIRWRVSATGIRFLEMYKVSSYEKKVIEILNREKVKFVKEKTFGDLHHGYYRFDFFLPEENILLEVQGRQHTEFTKIFYKNRSDFLKAQERDREKISYCLSHKIPLYCIPWWDMDKISSVKDLLNDAYLARTRYHNDNAYREYLKNREEVPRFYL